MDCVEGLCGDTPVLCSPPRFPLDNTRGRSRAPDGEEGEAPLSGYEACVFEHPRAAFPRGRTRREVVPIRRGT
jgi:hypothetical protein